MNMNQTLKFVWDIRLKLRAECKKLRAEGNKFYAEGEKLWAEGDKLWAEAILEVYGNIKIEWTSNGCKLENGEEYKE